MRKLFDKYDVAVLYDMFQMYWYDENMLSKVLLILHFDVEVHPGMSLLSYFQSICHYYMCSS